VGQAGKRVGKKTATQMQVKLTMVCLLLFCRFVRTQIVVNNQTGFCMQFATRKLTYPKKNAPVRSEQSHTLRSHVCLNHLKIITALSS
jgi:hypothetical protein